jgi:arabinan endo-1,5-alpha-L-arabinosidase
MLFVSFFTALLSLSFSGLASAQVNPGACLGACNVHDPAVIRRTSDGTYFRFSTGNKIQIATASALTGPWTNRGSALPNGSKINKPGNQDLWVGSLCLF